MGEQDDCVGEAGRDWGWEGGWEGGLTLRLSIGGDPAPEVSQALRLRRCEVVLANPWITSFELSDCYI